MSAPPSTAEAAIDQRLADLESTSVVSGGDPFAQLIHRMRLRKEYESAAANYLSLMKERAGPTHIGLKVLQVLEMIRARDVGLGRANVGTKGPEKRQPWSIAAAKQLTTSEYEQGSSESKRDAFLIADVSSLKAGETQTR